jgi:hypothetical protein
MVKEVTQDIFTSDVDVIIHQANCLCTMGSGIAREIKERFPEAYEADLATKGPYDREKKLYADPINKLGNFSVGVIKKEHRNTTPNLYLVYNLYGQLHFGKFTRNTNYESFYTGLELIKWDIDNRNAANAEIKNVGIPWKIASNQAGADWRIIKTMIEVIFEKALFNVLICKKP